MTTLFPSAQAALEEARDRESYKEFVPFLCGLKGGINDLSCARLLLQSALSIPDLDVARRWAISLIALGQPAREVARFIASQPVGLACVQDRRIDCCEDAFDEIDDGNLCEAAVYWETIEDAGFSEDRAIKSRYRADGRLARLIFTVGAQIKGYTAIRLDISNRKGGYSIETLRLVGAKGDVLWQWSGDDGDLTDVADLEIICPPDKGVSGPSGLVSTGLDPQFRLLVGEDVLARLSEQGGYCELVFRAFV